MLDVFDNKIGEEGAKALSTNTSLTTLLIGVNKIGAEGAKALAANTNLKRLIVHSKKIGDAGTKALDETDPLKRANLGRKVGIKSEVPSLKRLTMFAVKQEKLDQATLPQELTDDLKKPKI